MKAILKRAKSYYQKAQKEDFKKRIKSPDFTIISNNCWGYKAYQELDIPYLTPFVGLFLPSDSFLRMIANLRFYLDQPLTFLGPSEKKVKYPVGILGGDVEIHFMHYANDGEALEKWERRKQRISKDDDRIFIKFCDHAGKHSDRLPATPEDIRTFDSMSIPYSKICFTARPFPNLKSVFWIKECAGDKGVYDGVRLWRVCHHYADIPGWLNGGSGKLKFRHVVIKKLEIFVRKCLNIPL